MINDNFFDKPADGGYRAKRGTFVRALLEESWIHKHFSKKEEFA
jgi:hypothetical protein